MAIIERTRSREEMARAIVEDYNEHDIARLFFCLKVEWLVLRREQYIDSNWYALVTKALRCLQMKDYAALRRTIKEIEDDYCDYR